MSYTRIATTAASMFLALSMTLPGASAYRSHLTSGYGEKAPEPVTAMSPPTPTALVGPLTVYADTRDGVEDAVWAVDQFQAAGLTLPQTTVYLHDDRGACSEDPNRPINGYYSEVDGLPVIHVCAGAKTLVHELAHAWDHAFLDDSIRAKFLEHQGLEEWHANEWRECGAEHLAAVIAWAFSGIHPTLIGYYTVDELSAAYEIATGAAVPDRSEPQISTATAVSVVIDRPDADPTYRGTPS